MKGKNWLLLRITALALIVIAFYSAFSLGKVDTNLFWITLLITTIVSLTLVIELIIAGANIYRFIAEMDMEVNLTQREALYNFPAPTIILENGGKIIWYNQAFISFIYTDGEPFGIILNKVIDVDINKIYDKKGVVVNYNDKHYRITANLNDKFESPLSMVYFEDISEYVMLQEQYTQSRQSVILIMIDNYEDLLQNVRESEKANVLVKLEKLFESFMEKSTGIIRKISNDRFTAVVEEKYLDEMIAGRFKILDKSREIMVAEKLSITLSIGVGYGCDTLRASEAAAKQALDMALGRGGDQAAVKTESGFEFFGGVSKGIEKRAKVKTRIIATALMELIETSQKIYIMGHRFGDLDSIGSAVGLSGAIHNMGKHVKIVVDPVKNLAEVLIKRVSESAEINLFIAPEEAISDINDETLLIIVDTHNKDFVESIELYKRAKHIVVIDHHRKIVSYIDNAVIFHHEPFASSTSEMVTELIQYFGDVGKIHSYYADALLAGIALDTKNFVMRTGARTFEAAAFLRKLGADTIAVRGFFANSIDSYQKKNRLVASAEVYKRCAIAISDIQADDIRVVAPQAADELLGIAGVDASFVLYETNNCVNFSARSMGAMNVQVIMERLGGGGHQTMAGAQLNDVNLESARQTLLEAIDSHIKQSS